MSAAAIATWLDAQTTSLTAGNNLRVGRLPESPDLAAAIFDYTGTQPDFTMGSTWIDWPQYELVVRGPRNGYAEAHTLMDLIRGLLNDAPAGNYSGLTVLRIELVDTPASLPPDANDRPILSTRFTAAIQRS